MTKFGYLNEGNPFSIGESESQEMANCRIERGFIEYSDFQIPQGLYDSTPGRSVTLPNGKEVVVDVTNSLFGDHSYAGRGRVMIKKPTGAFERLGIKQPEVYQGLSSYDPIGDGTDYSNAIGSVTTQAGKYTYNITLKQAGSPLDYDADFVFRYVELNENVISGVDYSWFAGATGTVDVGKIILTLAKDPAGAFSLKIVFHKYNYPNRIFKYAGRYFYAITYYDGITGWESPPVYSELEIEDSHLNNHIGVVFFKFSNLKAPPAVLSLFPNIQIRLYRIPFGGSEYLLAKTLNGSINNTFYDDITDLNLGEVLSTEGNTDLPLNSNDVVSIAIHKERLFIALHNDRILYYSKPAQHNEFPAENFFVFDFPIVSITQHNEHLAIMTTQKVYMLYGTGLGFSVSRVDYNAGLIARNTGQSISGQLFAMWSNGEADTNRRRGVLLFNGLRAVDIGLKVRDTLNTGTALGGDASASKSNRNTVIDNRFYVVEVVDCWQINEFTTDSRIFNLVYDSYMNGFSLYDPSLKYKNLDCFVYRTKEFVAEKMTNPRLTQYHKGVWVRGVGKFQVELLGDGEVLTTAEFDLDNIEVVTTNVKHNRYNSFSIRFTGAIGAKIYDWGLLL